LAKRLYSREFKLAAIKRMAGGESVSLLGRELGVARRDLYHWRNRYRLGGVAALRSEGRPTKAEVAAMHSGEVLEPWAAAMPPPDPPDELALARGRIAELERKIGQQQVDLDFFKGALRRIKASRRPNDGPGGTASSPRSRR
jgi:transposase